MSDRRPPERKRPAHTTKPNKPTTDPARKMALELLLQIQAGESYSNLMLKRMDQARFSELDRRFISNLVYGSLRWRMRLDWAVNQHLEDTKLQDTVREILRLGAYQILMLDRVPDSAACNEAANLTREMGLERLVPMVNGVLRNLSRGKDVIAYPDREAYPNYYLSVYYSYPMWLIENFIAQMGFAQTERMLSYQPETHETCLRVNTLRWSVGQATALLSEQGFSPRSGALLPEALYIASPGSIAQRDWFYDGRLSVQGEASMLAVKALNPQPGGYYLDACAAPGGKSACLAEMIHDEGQIEAWDLHEHRVELIARNLQRLGLHSVAPRAMDATVIRQEYMGKFDGVLIDAPCSGLGVHWSKPEIKYRVNSRDVTSLHRTQLEMLHTCARYLRRGGTLVYATCTILDQENRQVVDEFLSTHPEFKAAAIDNLLPEGFDPGRVQNGCIQLWPHLDGTEGFFIARMTRT